MALVELRQVSKTFPLGAVPVHAVRDVDVTIGEGEFIAVWGPSGSGKTTLLNLLSLLDRPTHGEVHLQGTRIEHLSDARLSELRNRMLGIIFQTYNLMPVLSALENVMLPLQIRGVADGIARRKARTLLDEVELGTLAEHRPDQMSGGQRQRVAIARALIGDPSIVFADEPTANLDSNTSDLIIGMMHRLNQLRAVTFVFSTHDTRLLTKVARQLSMLDGRIVADRMQPCIA